MIELPNESNPAVILCGDAKSMLREVPDESVNCCVTSPPFFNLRDYQVEGQIGTEDSVEDYLSKLVEVFREVKRVLHQTGILFCNLGDTYSAKNLLCVPWRLALALQADGWILRADIPWVKRCPVPESCMDRPAKALEYMFMFVKEPNYFFDMDAIRKDMADSSGPRMSRAISTTHKNVNGAPGQTAHSLAKPREHGEIKASSTKRNFRNADLWFQSVESPHGLCGLGDELIGLDVTNEAYAEAHFACFPTALIEPLILAGTSAKGVCPTCRSPWTRITERTQLKRERPNDYTKRSGEAGTGNSCANSVAGVEVKTVGWEPSCGCNAGEPIPAVVGDCFLGSGTTLAVAAKLGRHGIGVELNPAYVELCKKRLSEPVGVGGLFGPAEIKVETIEQPDLFASISEEDEICPPSPPTP